ncbi:hypothetical protein ACVMB2_003914 [Sinorhizobium meliloti]
MVRYRSCRPPEVKLRARLRELANEQIIDGRARKTYGHGELNAAAPLNSTCRRRNMKLRSQNDATPPAIPTIA